jgi:hypothetical protein
MTPPETPPAPAPAPDIGEVAWLDHGRPCRGCLEARLSMQCAACGRPTAVVALASPECHIEWCARCWSELESVRVGRPLVAWPVTEYLAQQQRGQAAVKPGKRHQRQKHDKPAPQPQMLPWTELAKGA